ncbi:MAG: spermine synthase [Desulfobacteraceae bacterium]|nr:spermine synthase [Desulfobacteraceae bacterium]
MKKIIFIAILAMGFSGLVAQILLLRELLIVFSGNELCIGIILANWLILEAFGCFFFSGAAEKSKNKLEIFTIITISFSFFLLLAIFSTRILKAVMGISIGESISFLPMFYSSFLILLPVSILHGALFPFTCQIYSLFYSQDASSAGRVYVYETVGTIIAGIVCTYLFIPYLNSFQASSGLALLNLTICLFLLAPYWKAGLFQKTTLVILSGLIFFSGYLIYSQADKLHHYSIKAQWRNQNAVHYQNSQYGNICVIENQGQYIFFQDGIPNIITPVPDMHFIEEFVHLPLLVHPEPEKLLILSAGAGGMINEALKHPSVERIEYAELDSLILDLLRKFSTELTKSELNDRRVEIKHMDGRLLLKTSQDKYDLILLGSLEPSSLQTNRFFTKEFFLLVKERLNKEGILVIGLPGSLTYQNKELKNLNSCIYHTLKSVFSNIRVIPGDGTNLFLASNSGYISTFEKIRIIERLNQRKIKAEVIVPWRIENKLHYGWQNWFSSFIEKSSHKINYDFKPLGLFYSISHWNALYAPSIRWLFRQFEKINLWIIALLAAIFLLFYSFIRSKITRFHRVSIPFSIITTGFAGMIFDLMLIFTFQSIYGYVFSWIGLLMASFMAGAACGAMILTTVMDRLKNCIIFYIKIEIAIICFAVGCPFIFHIAHIYLGAMKVLFLFKLLFLVISFIGGLLIGSQFPLANKIYSLNSSSLSRTAGLLYASDLLGGWIGGVAGAVVILPVLGLTGACITVGLVKLTSLIVITTQPDRHQWGVKK